VFTLRDAAEVLRPKDAADHFADAIYLGFPLSVVLALGGVVCEMGQGYMKRLMAKNLELTAG
jgi:hypothetical protein